MRSIDRNDFDIGPRVNIETLWSSLIKRKPCLYAWDRLRTFDVPSAGQRHCCRILLPMEG